MNKVYTYEEREKGYLISSSEEFETSYFSSKPIKQRIYTSFVLINAESSIELESISKKNISKQRIKKGEEEESSFEIEMINKIARLEEWCELENPKEIKNFLRNNHQLMNIIFEALSLINGIFKNNEGLTLEIIKDPEEDFEGLFMFIKTPLSLKDALSDLGKLEDEWFFNLESSIRKIFSITVENI